MAQDLLEVLSDIEYLTQNQGIDIGLGYESYKQTILEKCIAPNKFFANHPEYLYQVSNGKKECALYKYDNIMVVNSYVFYIGEDGIIIKGSEIKSPPIAQAIEEYLTKCFNEGEFLGCSRQLLNSISKLPLKKLIPIAEPLEKTSLEAGILKILANREDYYPSSGFAGHLLAKFEKLLNEGIFDKQTLNLLEKYFKHAEHYSAYSSEGNFFLKQNKGSVLDVKLFEIMKKEEVDEIFRLFFLNKIIGGLANNELHLSNKAYIYIEDSIFKKHKISLAHDTSEEQLGKLVILFYGVANDEYIASDELLMFAEKYAEVENPDLSEPAKNCMWKMYKHIIETPGKEHLLADINKKLIDFFAKGYLIPDMILEAALKERFGYFSEFFLKLVVARELPEGIWPGVEKAVVDFLGSEKAKSSFTVANVNINVNEASEILKSSPILQSLFILKRVSEREELIDQKTLSAQLLPFIFNDFKPGEAEKFREIIIDYYHAMCREMQLEESDIEQFFEIYLKLNNLRTIVQLNAILSLQKLNNLHQEKLDLYYEIKKGQATETTFNRWEFITKYGSNVTKAGLLEKTGFCINELVYKNEFLYTACWAHKAVSIQKIYDQESAKIWENDYTSRFVLNKDELILLENKLYRLSQVSPKLEELVQTIDFLAFPDLLDFLDLVLDNQLYEDQLLPVFTKGYYSAKEAYSLVNKVLLKRAVEEIFALEKFRAEEKNFWRNIDKALQLGWQFDSFLEQLLKIRVENNKEVQAFLGGLEYIAGYEIVPSSYDHEFSYAREAFDLNNDKWLPKLQQIVRDNSFYFAKKQGNLLKELEGSNHSNPRIKQLLEEKYFEEKLDAIAKLKLEDELPNHDKPFSNWQKEDFLNWRATIDKIDDSNIDEFLAVLNQAVKIAHGFYLREVQLLSILSLFKSPTGGIAEIATGEGKTIIVAVFAALKVIAGHQVDVVTSSRVLAIRDSEEQKEFYDLLGITVAHNIDGTTTPAGGKRCYQADVVYGDMLYLVGDTLRDITYNVKEGRSFDILLVDEADSLFIDNTDMMVQLASAMPGFDMFKAVQLYSWFEAGRLGDMLERDATEKNCYKKIEENILWQDFNSTLLNLTALNDTQSYNQDANHTQLTEELNQIYAKYNSTDFNVTEDANKTFTKILLNRSCIDYLGEYSFNFTRDYLLATYSLASNQILIPKHLMYKGPEHLQAWSDSLISAAFYNRENVDYLVYDNYGSGRLNNITIISPIDKDTGTLQTSMQWSNGLHQFLQLKHKLAMTPENLISTFNSYPGFFKKYKGNIFGLTGTTGNAEHHKFMKEIYDVEVSVIPTFVYKDTNEFTTSFARNESDWLSLIAGSAERRVIEGRAVLIIVPTVEEVKKIYFELITDRYVFTGMDQVKIYGQGLLIEEEHVKKPLKAGDVIVATNLAGRGTDLKLSKQVVNAGGLHVILGYLPESERVEKQAFGRAARKGEPGSVQIILNNDALLTYKEDCFYGNITCLKEERTGAETKHLAELAHCKLPITFARDELFNQYVEFVTSETSPTKYKLILAKPGRGGFDDEKSIYVYQDAGKLYLHVIKNDQAGKVEETIALSEFSSFLAPTVEKHLKAVFSKAEYSSSSLSKQDYELINFLAAYKGFTDNPITLLRTEYELFFLAAKHYLDKKNNNDLSTRSINKILKSVPRAEAEREYLTDLLLTDEDYIKLKEELPLDENGAIKEISPQILARVKIAYYYAAWLEDRALYHKEYEIMQINEHFAHWLFEHKVMSYDPGKCDTQSTLFSKGMNFLFGSKAENKLKEWQQLFTGFEKEISDWHTNGKLLQNPAYTIYKAWHLLSVEDKMQMEKARLGLDQKEKKAFSSHLLKYKNYINYYDYLKEFKSELNFISDWQQSDGNYLIQDPMKLAVQLLEKELALGDTYSKFALYNTLSFIRLIKDGRGIWHLKQGEKAVQVMTNFNNDAQAALEALNGDLVQHYQGQLNYMMVNGLAYMDTDLTLQLIGQIELYKKLNETLFNNLLKLEENNGKQMIRVGRNIDIEVMADSINITRAVEETFGLKDLTNETRHNIMELVNSLELKSKSLITAELANMGVMVFEIELYDLKEPKKHWWKTVLVGVLGVLQIVAGIYMMGIPSPFMQMVGMGTIFSGIGDVLSSIQSFATKTPIDLEFYLKAKAMSYAITITLAGIGSAAGWSPGSWAGQVEAMANKGLHITENMLKTSMLLKGFAVQGLMMGVQPLLTKAADRAVDKNKGNLEASAWRRVDGLFSYYNEAFKRIHVAEKVLNSNQYSSSILSETRQIVQDENKRFKNDGMNYGIGVASGAMGYAAGGIGMGGFFATRAFDAGLHGILGGVKSGEVLDRSVARLGHKVEEIAASVPKTAKLLEMRLHGRFDTKVKEVSAPLMAVLAANKFIDNAGDINYKDCRKIETFEFAESYKQYMQALVDGCEEINRAMDLGQEPAKRWYEEWSFKLKRSIQSVLTGGLIHIMKQDVVAPQINIWGGGALKEGFTWLFEKFWHSSNPKKESAPKDKTAAGNEQGEEKPEEPKQNYKPKRPQEEAQETRTSSKPKPKGAHKPKDKPTANDNTYGPQPCRDDTCNAGGYNSGESSTNPDHGRVLAEAAFREKAKNLIDKHVHNEEDKKILLENLQNLELNQWREIFAAVDGEINKSWAQKFWDKLPSFSLGADANAAAPIIIGGFAIEKLMAILAVGTGLFIGLKAAEKAATQQQKEFDYRRNNDRQEERNRDFRAQAGGSAPMPDPDDHDWEPGEKKYEDWAKKYSENRSKQELDRSINSIRKQMDLHQDKIANPHKYVSDWEKMSSIQRQGLLGKWQKEIYNFDNQVKALNKIINKL